MDKKIEKAISKLLEMYEKIENDLLIEIASHFSIKDGFYNSDHWRIKKLEEMGLFNQDIIDYLKRATGRTDLEIKNALNQIGVDTINLDKLNRLFEDEILKINPNVLINNYTIKNIINTAYNELSNTLIQMSSKIEKATREAYLNIVEEAYLKVSMGTHSYQEAIRESINELGNKGINTLVYKTTDEKGNVLGIRNYDIESAVRREVLTASRQLNNNLSMEVANELECEYLYLSEHLQCRPNHFEWQGTIIKREDLIKITHYGEIDGLAGINCRHYFEPYFGDARSDDLKHYSKKECESAYNLSQHQRYLEKGIRKWKRKTEMFKVNDDNNAYLKCKVKTNEWQSRLNNYVKENGLSREFNREYVNKNEKKILSYKDITQEWLKNATPNSNKIKNLNYYEYNGVKYKVDGKNVIFDYSKKEQEVAEWLKTMFGGEIFMIPKINNPEGISTPDYLFRNMKFDLKEIKGNGKRTIDSSIKNKKRQSNNFIFDVTKSNLTKKEIIDQVKKIYITSGREWVDVVIIKKHNKLIAVYKKRS